MEDNNIHQEQLKELKKITASVQWIMWIVIIFAFAAVVLYIKAAKAF
jgi:cell division protein FtsX